MLCEMLIDGIEQGCQFFRCQRIDSIVFWFLFNKALQPNGRVGKDLFIIQGNIKHTRYDIADTNISTSGDDLLVAADNVSNSGTVGFLGNNYYLWDKSDGNFSFKFNDEDDHRLGSHATYQGDFVGWGWLNPTSQSDPTNVQHIADSDWLFTAESGPQVTRTPVPEPTTMLLLGTGLLGLVGLGRRKFLKK